MVLPNRILSDVVYLPAIPMILGLCKIADALWREKMTKGRFMPPRSHKPWLLYLAVPAYLLLSAA